MTAGTDSFKHLTGYHKSLRCGYVAVASACALPSGNGSLLLKLLYDLLCLAVGLWAMRQDILSRSGVSA